VRTFGRVLLVTAVATQLVFPVGYNALLKTHSFMPLVTLTLAVSNLLLLWLAYYAVRLVGVQTRTRPGGGADRPPAEPAA
jgi:hypothetical protein